MFSHLNSVAISSVLISSLLFSASVTAQNERYSPQQLQDDLHIAQRALEEAHGGIYRYRPKSYIDQQFKDALLSLKQSGDALDFYRVLKPTVASIACGHTTALLSLHDKEALKQELLLPFEVKVLQGRVFIFRDLSETTATQQFAGREILSINGLEMKTILNAMTTAMHGDGNIPTMRAIEVGRAFKEMLFTLLQMRGEFNVVLREAGSKNTEHHQFKGRSLETLKQTWSKQYPQDQDPDRFITTNFFDEGNIAYLKIDKFIAAGTGKDGATQFKEVFETIREKASHTLVIDVRDNGGGEDALGKLLFSHLVDQPFSYYDTLTIKTDQFTMDQYAEEPIRLKAKWLEARPDGQFNFLRHPNLGTQQPSSPTFKGRVLVLINGGSYSTTAEFLTQVHTRHRATFIGEESGGAYYGNTSGHHMMLTLPNTKVRLVVPLMTYQLSTQSNSKTKPAADRGVMPDYPVQRTIDDYLQGRDPELRLALKLAKQTK